MQWTLKELTKVAPRSGGIRFEIKVKGHVIIDVHAIVQKWNSCGFVSRPYHRLPRNLGEKFRGAYILLGGMGQIVKAAKITYAP